MTKDLIELADIDFKNVNYSSVIAIFMIILVVFLSPSIPAILVLCVELAILINMAIPFYTGQVIPFIASIVIGTVQLGATVDYAILLTTRFREELINGHEKAEAMEIAIKTSIKSIVTSALTFFAATASVGLISRIKIIKTLCIMISRGALISMAAVIFVLPPVLLVCERFIAATSKNWRNRS